MKGAMMILRKGLLLVVLVLGMAAIAPAGTSAKWLDDEQPIPLGETFSDQFHGQLEIKLPPVLYFSCTVEMKVSASATGANVTGFSVNTGSCFGSGLPVNCKLIDDYPTPDWPIHTNRNQSGVATDLLTITEVKQMNIYGSIMPGLPACPLIGSSEMHWPKLTANIVGGTTSIKSIEILSTQPATNNLQTAGTLTSTSNGTLGVE